MKPPMPLISPATEENIEQPVSKPVYSAGQALESLGTVAPSASMPSAQASATQAKQIQEMAAIDKVNSERQALRITQELGVEMKRLRQLRERQLAERRTSPSQPAPNVESSPLAEPAAKPKKGLFGMGRPKRVKSAMEQSQPETSAKRVGE